MNCFTRLFKKTNSVIGDYNGFLLDENMLGFSKYLPKNLTIHQIGDSFSPPKRTKDTDVLDFAQLENLIIITMDKHFVKQIKKRNMECVYVRITHEIITKQIFDYLKGDNS